MSFFIENALAEGSQPPPTADFGFLIMLAVFFVIFYLMIIRPQQKRAKEHRNMIDALSKGDEIVTSGGVLGKVKEVGENFITLEIAKDVEIRVQRNAIGSVMPKGTIKQAS